MLSSHSLVESPCPDALEQPVEFSRRQYVLQELFNVFPVYDMADEVGRNALQALLYDTLTGDCCLPNLILGYFGVCYRSGLWSRFLEQTSYFAGALEKSCSVTVP